MKQFKDLTGQKFNKLTVLKFAGKSNRRAFIWLCRCDCGTEKIVATSALTHGAVKTCGCYNFSEKKKLIAFANGKANITHGMSKNPLFKSTWSSWSMMMQRCTNPKRKDFVTYGARGIKPCAFLSESPRNLLDLIGVRPEGMSIDRIDVDLGYTCGSCSDCKNHGWVKNVKWSTFAEQVNNKQTSVKITIKGIAKTCREWAEELGVGYFDIYNKYGRT